MKEGWTYKKLGEVCLIERGGSPRPIQQYLTDEDDGLNWIKIGDAVEGSKYITSTKEKIKPEGLKKTRFVHKGDFILSNSMSFGKPYILDIDGCIHDGWLVIRDDSDTFNKSFLYYMLSSPNMYQEFRKLAVGGVVNNLNSSIVRNVVVPIPPMAEQERIVAELDLLQGIIEKKKEQLKAYDQLAQSIFYTMFGDPIDNPKGWEVKKLSDISSLITDGSHYSPKHDEYGDIPMLSVKDMRDTHFEYENCKWIGRIEYEKLVTNGCKPIKNDVLIAKDGSYFKYIFVLTNEREQAILSSIAILRPIIDIVNPHFVAKYLSTAEIYSKVEREYLTGTAIKRVILKGIRKLPIFLPPLSLQQEFAEKVEAIERQKALVQQSIEETQTMFDYTMDKYFG